MEELASFAEKLKAENGISTVFSYCHSGLYEDGQLPAGMEGWDNNIECADTLLADFRARGVVVSDSRDAYRASGLTMDEAINKSDVHWSHKMALGGGARDRAHDERRAGAFAGRGEAECRKLRRDRLRAPSDGRIRPPDRL